MKFPILIISYTFPPAKGIGGRRWSKFAKYLSGRGHDVHVICHARDNESRLYSNSLKSRNLQVHEVKGFYPEILSSRPEGLLQKLKYQFWMRILPLFHRGNIYDRSIFMSNSLRKKVKEVCNEHDIDHVILTCAPFYQSKVVTELKKELGFHLTVDIRDPWTWGEGYGYTLLSPVRMKREKELETQVMLSTDFITSPSSSVIAHLAEEYGESVKEKLRVIPHGVDPESFLSKTSISAQPVSTDALRFIYAGSLYEGYEQFLDKLLLVLQNAQKNSPELFNRFSFDVFSMNPVDRFRDQVIRAGLVEKVKFHEAVPEQQLFEEMKKYDRTLIFFPEKFKDFISTKFYELIYARIPLIYVGYPGKVSEFIEQNELGTFIEWTEFESSFAQKIERDIDITRFDQFDMEPYLYENLTEELVQSIE